MLIVSTYQHNMSIIFTFLNMLKKATILEKGYFNVKGEVLAFSNINPQIHASHNALVIPFNFSVSPANHANSSAVIE